MKLNKTKIRYILRQNRKGYPQKEIAQNVKVSQWKSCRSSKSTKGPGKNLSWAKVLVAPPQTLPSEWSRCRHSSAHSLPLRSANAGDCGPETI